MQCEYIVVNRRTLPDDAPNFFDPAVNVLVATVVVNVINQVSAPFTVHLLKSVTFVSFWYFGSNCRGIVVSYYLQK